MSADPLSVAAVLDHYDRYLFLLVIRSTLLGDRSKLQSRAVFSEVSEKGLHWLLLLTYFSFG